MDRREAGGQGDSLFLLCDLLFAIAVAVAVFCVN